MQEKKVTVQERTLQLIIEVKELRKEFSFSFKKMRIRKLKRAIECEIYARLCGKQKTNDSQKAKNKINH